MFTSMIRWLWAHNPPPTNLRSVEKQTWSRVMMRNGSYCVATLLLEEWEDDSHTPEMGTWESVGTPKTSEFDCRGQNILQ
jgi:hypothetical protein